MIPQRDTSIVAITGAATMPPAGPIWERPLARPSWSSSTSAGTAAWAAGIWMAVPMPPMTAATTRCHTSSLPSSANARATRVPTAAIESPVIITPAPVEPVDPTEQWCEHHERQAGGGDQQSQPQGVARVEEDVDGDAETRHGAAERRHRLGGPDPPERGTERSGRGRRVSHGVHSNSLNKNVQVI